MELIHFTPHTRYTPSRPLAIALGNFDGVHRAHQALLTLAEEEAEKKQFLPAVFTFEQNKQPFLTNREDRLLLFEKAGIHTVLLADFDQWKDLSPAAFLDCLKESGIRLVAAGFNFHFGKDACGTTETLAALAGERAMETYILPPLSVEGDIVSSHRIRSLLKEGRPADAARLLGRPHSLAGQVAHGFALGRQLSTPTLNLPLSPAAAPLRQGVYVTTVRMEERNWKAISNYGNNPTFDRNSVTLETHLLEPVKDSLYGKEIRVFFHEFLRPEEKFSSPEALKAAIQQDIASALAYHERRSR